MYHKRKVSLGQLRYWKRTWAIKPDVLWQKINDGYSFTAWIEDLEEPFGTKRVAVYYPKHTFVAYAQEVSGSHETPNR